MRPLLSFLAIVALSFPVSAICSAQQIDRSQLPLPDAPFKGKIKKTFEGSEQDYPQPVAPPQGAPNVLLILIDDLGF